MTAYLVCREPIWGPLPLCSAGRRLATGHQLLYGERTDPRHAHPGAPPQSQICRDVPSGPSCKCRCRSRHARCGTGTSGSKSGHPHPASDSTTGERVHNRRLLSRPWPAVVERTSAPQGV
jgi:hypothetical protein